MDCSIKQVISGFFKGSKMQDAVPQNKKMSAIQGKGM
jgi:hypothetical protein